MREKEILLFAEHLRKKERSDNTVEKYVRDAKRFAGFLGEREDFTKLDVIEFKEDLQKRYKISSANSIIAAVNVFLKFLGRGDCTVSKFRTQEQKIKSDADNLMVKDIHKILNVRGRRKFSRPRILAITIAELGIRVSEVQFLTVQAIKGKCIEITNKGKTRTILVTDFIRKLLLEYCRRVGIKSGVIFRNSAGKALTRQTLWADIKSLGEFLRIDVKKLFPHNLRNFFARNFYGKTKNLVLLSVLLGHQSIDTTKHYAQQTLSTVRRLMSEASLANYAIRHN